VEKEKTNLLSSVLVRSGFLLLLFLYFWLVVDPRLIYDAQRPVFFYQISYLAQSLTYPGGLIEFLSNFITQFYTISWLGALLMTLIVLLLASTIRGILLVVSAAPIANFVEWVIVAPVAALQASYLFKIIHTAAFEVLLLTFLIFLKLVARDRRLQVPLFFLFAAALYFVIGGYALFFALFCILFVKQKSLLTSMIYGLIFAVIILVIPQLYYQVLYFDPTTLYSCLLPLTLEPKLKFIFSVFLLLLLGFMIFYRFRRLPSKDKEKETSADSLRPPQIAVAAIALFLMVALSFLTLDAKYRIVLRVNSYAENRQWPLILSTLKEHKEINHRLTNLQLYRALYFTGQLGEKLFEYPVGEHADGLYRSDQASFTLAIEYCDLLLDLGNLNGAQHKAYEAWAVEGKTPRVLQHLASIHIAKKEYAVAENYLLKLKKTCKYNAWTKKQLRLCAEKIFSREHEGAENLPKNAPAFLIRPGFAHAELLQLVQSQPQDRMAAEYLLAYDLLAGRIDYFMENLPYFQQFTQELPRAFEEAVVLYLSSGLPATEKQQSIPIRQKVVTNFTDFMKILQKHGNEKVSAFLELQQKYGDTFWFYYLYHKPEDAKL
jgi:hypothetical protein